MRIYWQHATRYPIALLTILLFLIGVVVANSYYPFIYKDLFDQIAAGSADLASLLGLVIKILLVNALVWVFWRITIFTINFFQPRVKADILNSCFDYLHDHSYGFFTNNFAGSLVRKVGRFERAFEDIMDKVFFNIGQTFLKLAIVIGILFFYNHTIAWIMLVWAVVYVSFAFIFSRYKYKYDLAESEIDSKVSGFLADTIGNNLNIKLFGGKKQELRSFAKLTDELFRRKKRSWDIGQINESILVALLILLEFAVMYTAVKLWYQGIITAGGIVLLQVYMVQIFGSIWDLGGFIRVIFERLADAEEMSEILTTPHEVQDSPNAKQLSVKQGMVVFDGISFGYKNKKVFHKFNLTIKPGERVALIGPSGGGKTTVVKLLFRFFDLQGGRVSIDGQDIAKVTQESLREQIALVPQEPILFHRSLYDNIAYARPHASEREIYEAAKLAHAHEFITSFPEGYNTFVGERGVKLSGGERQRVAIARAILKNAPILVLDEATSSLDSESERLIQDALKNLMQGKTTIVIAHRLSTIMQMDRIVVVKKGQIVEEGKHQELLKARKGIYQKLWEIQAGGFAQTD